MAKMNMKSLYFGQHLGDNKEDLPEVNQYFTWVGDQTRKESGVFQIGSKLRPADDAYLLIRSYDVDNQAHTIRVNGKDLPGINLATKAKEKRWQVFYDQIPANTLHAGENLVQIFRNKSSLDNFVIHSIIVHWIEND